jgi:hypothetical protein
MTDDDFGKTGSKLIENAAVLAVGVAGTFLTGPGGGVAASATVQTALEWLHARADRNDTLLYEARFAELEGLVNKLDDEVRNVKAQLAAVGKQADRQDFLSQEAVYSEFTRSVAEAITPEKRIAIINATAHQFDPRKGSAAARTYWLNQVKALTDIEAALVSLLGRHPKIAFNGACFAVNLIAGQDKHDAVLVPEFDLGDVVALEVTALRMSDVAGPTQPLTRSGFVLSIPEQCQMTTNVYSLTPSGQRIAEFMSD